MVYELTEEVKKLESAKVKTVKEPAQRPAFTMYLGQKSL